MKFKGVLIDFYYTLAYVDQEVQGKHREEFASVFTRHGYKTTLDRLSSALTATSRNSKKGEIKDLYEFYRLFLRKLGIPESLDLIRELTELWTRHVATGCKLYDNVIPVLSDLKKRSKVALVSNCSVGLSDVIKALGLTPFFECIVLSYEVGVLKPDRQIYLEALRRLKLEPEECVFVSDEISDLEGAREVGLKALLVRQGEYTTHNAKDPNFKPDFQCNHISEITRFL